MLLWQEKTSSHNNWDMKKKEKRIVPIVPKEVGDIPIIRGSSNATIARTPQILDPKAIALSRLRREKKKVATIYIPSIIQLNIQIKSG